MSIFNPVETLREMAFEPLASEAKKAELGGFECELHHKVCGSGISPTSRDSSNHFS
jgi:hypothetical protein